VRGISNWAGSEGLSEANAIGSKSVQYGSLDFVIAVTMNMIGAKRINGDEKNVRRRRFGPYLRTRDGGNEYVKSKRESALHGSSA